MLLGSNPFIIPTNNHAALYDVMGNNVVVWSSFWLKNGLRSNRIPIPSKWALSWNVGTLFPELKLVTFHFILCKSQQIFWFWFYYACMIAPFLDALVLHTWNCFSVVLSWDPDKIQTQIATGRTVKPLGTCDREKTNCQWLSAICLWLFFPFLFYMTVDVKSS